MLALLLTLLTSANPVKTQEGSADSGLRIQENTNDTTATIQKVFDIWLVLFKLGPVVPSWSSGESGPLNERQIKLKSTMSSQPVSQFEKVPKRSHKCRGASADWTYHRAWEYNFGNDASCVYRESRVLYLICSFNWHWRFEYHGPWFMDPKVTTPISNRNRLHFQHESVNHGGGYNATSGCFEAPKTGTYFFSVTLYVRQHFDPCAATCLCHSDASNPNRILWLV